MPPLINGSPSFLKAGLNLSFSGAEKLVRFSCKTRGFCPYCYANRRKFHRLFLSEQCVCGKESPKNTQRQPQKNKIPLFRQDVKKNDVIADKNSGMFLIRNIAASVSDSIGTGSDLDLDILIFSVSFIVRSPVIEKIIVFRSHHSFL